MIEIRNLTVTFGGVRRPERSVSRYWRKDHRTGRSERRRKDYPPQCHEWLRQERGRYGER